mmetsp:Transcript_129106/g.373657  ORF Transcript_129106/g.373657 Transcript_129106/m.373657 type:complete len:288 (-) Transcript_129106:301-1164(-)
MATGGLPPRMPRRRCGRGGGELRVAPIRHRSGSEACRLAPRPVERLQAAGVDCLLGDDGLGHRGGQRLSAYRRESRRDGRRQHRPARHRPPRASPHGTEAGDQRCFSIRPRRQRRGRCGGGAEGGRAAAGSQWPRCAGGAAPRGAALRPPSRPGHRPLRRHRRLGPRAQRLQLAKPRLRPLRPPLWRRLPRAGRRLAVFGRAVGSPPRCRNRGRLRGHRLDERGEVEPHRADAGRQGRGAGGGESGDDQAPPSVDGRRKTAGRGRLRALRHHPAPRVGAVRCAQRDR